MIKPQTLKGFRDFLPKEAIARQWLIGKIVEVFERFGFDPLETPAIEYEEVLLGKYGEEGDKLLYRFQDKGERNVALRYDQTVPAARVVAQYPDLPKPFKRYQIQPVWRAEKPQKGRFREFLQCDADIFGTTSPLADAEVIALSYFVLRNIGFSDFKILYNDRSLFQNLPLPAIQIIDKLGKIGKDKVKEELRKNNLPEDLVDQIEKNSPTPILAETIDYAVKLGVEKTALSFSPTLARGLDYYTSMIFEINIEGYDAGSVCGGGRYDKLIGMFAGFDIPATGFAFGFDRLVEAANQFNLIPKKSTSTQILVTIFSKDFINESLSLTSKLRSAGIAAEIYPDLLAKLDKQLKYADKKGILYVAIIGPDEAKNGTVTLKNLKEKKQETVLLDDLVKLLR